MASQIKFRVMYYGDRAEPETGVEVARLDVADLGAPEFPTANARGEPPMLRVRASGFSEADVAKVRGTNWTDATLTDPRTGREVVGRISKLELTSDDELEFILNPS